MAATEPTSTPGPDRRLAAVVVASLAGLVALLSFADGAPDAVRRGLRVAARAIARVQELLGIQLVDLGDLPFEWDIVGHFVLWAAVAVVGRWAFRHRVAAVSLGLGCFAASYLVEIGQSVLTVSRRPDLRDLGANALGIVVGLVFAVGAERTAAVVRRIRGLEPIG